MSFLVSYQDIYPSLLGTTEKFQRRITQRTVRSRLNLGSLDLTMPLDRSEKNMHPPRGQVSLPTQIIYLCLIFIFRVSLGASI